MKRVFLLEGSDICEFPITREEGLMPTPHATRAPVGASTHITARILLQRIES